MGRKIRGKKHRGVKNPYEQSARRFASIADKINHAPVELDHQEVPRSVRNIMEYCESSKKKQKELKKKRKRKLKLQIRESEEAVKLVETQNVSKPVEEPSYDRTFDMESSEEESMNEEFSEEELMNEELSDEESYEKLMSKITNLTECLKTKAAMEEKHFAVPKQKQSQKMKRREKLLKIEKLKNLETNRYAKKRKNTEDVVLDFSDYKDEVKFGEIVHEPPTLTFDPRSKIQFVEKPGERDLLLKKLLYDGTKVSNSKKKKEIDVARKEMLEEERIRVVEYYRAMKANRKK